LEIRRFRRFQQIQIFRIRKKGTQEMGKWVPAFLIRSSVSISVDPWLDFHACEKTVGNFFVSPLGSTARSRRRVGRRFIVRQAQRLRRLGRAAAARSTGLRPIHFIHFIEAAINARA
jgi:hypothetical protein